MSVVPAGPHSDLVVFATTAAVSTEAFVNPVAAEVARRGHRVHLVAGDRQAAADFPHTSSVIPMQRDISVYGDVRSLKQWVKHLRELRPGAVVIGTPKASLLGLNAARIVGIPTRVYVIHGAVWDGATGTRRLVLETAERRTLAASTHQLAVSDSLARLITARRLSSRTPHVIGAGSFCGVDTERFQPANLPASSQPSMVFVGRLNRDKGIDVLLRTLDRVREHVDASLTVVGGLDTTAPPPGTTLARLERDPHVTWIGATPDVVPPLRQASLLLFPTAREGLPQVPLEAQACGVPVISWRATGVVDAVRDGFTGLLVGYQDEAALAREAVRLLTDDALRRRLAHNARSFAVERFGRNGVVERNGEYLSAVLNGCCP